MLPKPIRFVVVGVCNTGFALVVFWLALRLVAWMGLYYLWATVPGFVLNTSVSWYSQRRFVFGDAARAAPSYLKFLTIQVVYYFINLPLLAFGVWAGLRPFPAQVLVTVLLVGISYVLYDRFTFHARA